MYCSFDVENGPKAAEYIKVSYFHLFTRVPFLKWLFMWLMWEKELNTFLAPLLLPFVLCWFFPMLATKLVFLRLLRKLKLRTQSFHSGLCELELTTFNGYNLPYVFVPYFVRTVGVSSIFLLLKQSHFLALLKLDLWVIVLSWTFFGGLVCWSLKYKYSGCVF